MTRLEHLTLTLVAAAGGLLLAVGTASAHAGEEHTTGGLGAGDGLGLIAVALIAGLVWWLANRKEARPPGRDRPHRNAPLNSDGSRESRPAVPAVTRADATAMNSLVAVRRLRPPRQPTPRRPPRTMP